MPRPKKDASKETAAKKRAPRKTTTKKTTRKKSAARKKKLTEYEKAMEKSVPQWLSYSGNKRQLVPIIADIMPSPANRFLDLFGGTGITGVDIHNRGKCKKVIYNDLEYDMVLLLEWLKVTPKEEILETYTETKERWFGDTDRMDRFEEDTNEYKKRTGDERGGAHKQIWNAMKDHYNKTRIILWDREEDAEITKIINSVEDKDLRLQLIEFLNGIEIENVEPMGFDKRKIDQVTDEELRRGWQRTLEYFPEFRDKWDKLKIRDIRENQARSHKQHKSIDTFAARGDFFNPGELLFLMLNSKEGIQEWQHSGRKINNLPSFGKKINSLDKVMAFVDALQKTPIEFYSHSFYEGWIDRENERPRTKIANERWKRMLASLNTNDVVFIDPPYHESKASYNRFYSQELEIYLFAFCTLLTERGIPFIFTDNLHWENDLFKNWIKDYYVYKLKPGALKLYQRTPEANDQEVIVCNFKPTADNAIGKDKLEWLRSGKNITGLIKWKTNGKRELGNKSIGYCL